MKKLSSKNIPNALDEAVAMLYAALSEKDKQYIQQDPNWAEKSHHDFGLYLRNFWKFWNPQSTSLRLWFAQNLQVAHPDDMSGTILKALSCKVNGEKFSPLKHVQNYRKHWKKMKRDPLVGDSAPITLV